MVNVVMEIEEEVIYSNKEVAKMVMKAAMTCNYKVAVMAKHKFKAYNQQLYQWLSNKKQK